MQTPQTEAELAALRRSVERGTPYGPASWVKRTALALGLESSLNNRAGRRSGRLQAKGTMADSSAKNNPECPPPCSPRNDEFRRRLQNIANNRPLTCEDYWEIRARLLWEYFGI